MAELWQAIPGHEIVKTLVALIALVATIFRIYRKRIVPAADALVRVDKAVPVLMRIAAEFSPNGGESLHDRIVRTETAVREITAKLADVFDVVENTESTIEAQERMTIRLLVAMADVARRMGMPDVIANLPTHVEESRKEL